MKFFDFFFLYDPPQYYNILHAFKWHIIIAISNNDFYLIRPIYSYYFQIWRVMMCECFVRIIINFESIKLQLTN